MNIAILVSTFPPYRGGMGNAAYHESAALARRGHSVTVFTPDSVHADPAPADAPPGVQVRRLTPALAWGHAAFSPRIAREACAAADVILLHYPFFGVAEPLQLMRALGRHATRTRVVLRYDMDVRGERLLRVCFAAHRALVLPTLLANAEHVIFSTLDYARESDAAGVLARSPQRCSVIPYGVDPERFFVSEDVERAHNRILFVGGLDRAHYFKGLERLLEALALCHSKGSELLLTVVGRGEREDALRTQALELGIADQVRFDGDCDDAGLRRHYQEAAYTVLPSVDRSESFGLVLIEAMACGSGVIVSDIPGARELTHGGETGYVIPRAEDDIYTREDLARLLVAATRDAERARQHSIAASRRAHETYTWDQVADKLERALRPE